MTFKQARTAFQNGYYDRTNGGYDGEAENFLDLLQKCALSPMTHLGQYAVRRGIFANAEYIIKLMH
jgi:hypothetical protein